LLRKVEKRESTHKNKRVERRGEQVTESTRNDGLEGIMNED
jgi:hypothetical protein